MRWASTLVVILAVLAVATAGVGGQGALESFEGQYVSLDATERAVTEYAVSEDVVAASIRAESEGSLGGERDLASLSNLEGQAIDRQQLSETSATMVTATAQIEGHDNPRGVLTVQPMEQPQYVRIELPEGAETTDEGDGSVTYETADGTAASVLLVGDGELIVEDGNVLARVAPDGLLVLRASPAGDTEDFTEQNRLIADGDAIAEAYVVERDPDVVTDTVSYDAGTAIEGTQTESGADLRVDHAGSDGAAVIVGVSRSLVAPDAVEVTVDGEPAERTDSYDELVDALGGDQSRYLLAEPGETDTTDVAVAVNEFPDDTSQIAVSASADGEDSGGGDGNEGDADGGEEGNAAERLDKVT